MAKYIDLTTEMYDGAPTMPMDPKLAISWHCNLDNLGYTCVVECENEAKPVNFVTDFLEKDVKTAENISRYSFDVRA